MVELVVRQASSGHQFFVKEGNKIAKVFYSEEEAEQYAKTANELGRR